MNHSLLFACLCSGNVVYQAFQSAPDYVVALERSLFQGIAVLLAWMLIRRNA